MNELEILYEALGLLKDVPEDQWTTDIQFDKSSKECCALGHYRIKKAGLTTKEAFKLEYIWELPYDIEAIRLNHIVRNNLGEHLTKINNGKSDNFVQPTPKERTIAALEATIDKLKDRHGNRTITFT